MKEYNNFETFYNDVKKIALQISALNGCKQKGELIYARENIDENILKSYYIIGTLEKSEADALASKTRTIKLSIDTMLKNYIKHKELTIQDYSNIKKYMKEAEYILKSSNKNLIYFKTQDKIYQIVIKTTKDKQENFITTFHKSSRQQLIKDLKRYEQIKR